MSVDELSKATTPTTLDGTAGELAEPVGPGGKRGQATRLSEAQKHPWYGIVWSAAWPKMLALAMLVLVWQLVVWSGWRETYVLPSPATVWDELTGMFSESRVYAAIYTTMRRAVTGFALALGCGTLLGIGVVQWRPLRTAIGSLLSGLQTMPSIAWFPLAILLFGGTAESPIMFVVILGAAPSIANGVISGVDEVPPALRRTGRMLGATGVNRYRHVVLPAAMPAYLSGLKQGWAFSWRSLMAGELLLTATGKYAIGSDLALARSFGQPPRLLAYMIVILVIGMLVDSVFGVVTDSVRRRRGLTRQTA